MDFVDATPAPELTPSLVEQLMEIVNDEDTRSTTDSSDTP
jgi:hypothetical protein